MLAGLIALAPPVAYPATTPANPVLAYYYAWYDEGSFNHASWDGALASSPSWALVVSTFNEWMESTQIEPSVQWGDQYLQQTRRNADLFKAST